VRYLVRGALVVGIRIDIVRWIDDGFPGWVECRFFDASGTEHRVQEKAPVVTSADISAASSYPQPGVVACTVLRRDVAADGHEIVSVTTEQPYGIQSTDGRNRFDVPADSLVECPGRTNGAS
jgi:hypothetical protein